MSVVWFDRRNDLSRSHKGTEMDENEIGTAVTAELNETSKGDKFEIRPREILTRGDW